MKNKLIYFLILGLILSCNSNTETADTIYINGKIYTVNDAQPWAEAVAIKDGKFQKVGSSKEIEGFKGENTKVIDLEGKFSMPGMIDVHTHVIDAALPVIQLSDYYDVKKIQEEVKAAAEANPGDGWLYFNMYGFGIFPGDNGPKELLDEVVSDRPVMILHQSGHAFWVNSKALELAGITKDTPDPHQGIIARKPNGEPAGGLQERAMQLIWKARPAWTKDEIENAVNLANEVMASNGLTATREAGITPERYEVLKALEAEGKLKARYDCASHWQTTTTMLTPPNEEIFSYLMDNKDKQSSKLQLRTLKVFMDGVPASHTALLSEPYTDRPDTKGWQLIPQEELEKALVKYDKNGVSAIFHCTGDQAVTLALDAIEAVRKANGDMGTRHHISHTLTIEPSDLPRFKELGVVADFSPYFAFAGPMHDNHVQAVGEERFKTWFPTKTLMAQGIPVALATDAPVADYYPLPHIETAITRVNPFDGSPGSLAPEEAISLEEAIKAYTITPAYILGWENKIGSIEEGKYADMVILDNNLFEIEPSEISEVKIFKTIFEGEVVYEMK